MKPVAWMLFLATTASFATTVALGRFEERQRQARAELGQPAAAAVVLFQRASASGSIE